MMCNIQSTGPFGPHEMCNNCMTQRSRLQLLLLPLHNIARSVDALFYNRNDIQHQQPTFKCRKLDLINVFVTIFNIIELPVTNFLIKTVDIFKNVHQFETITHVHYNIQNTEDQAQFQQ